MHDQSNSKMTSEHQKKREDKVCGAKVKVHIISNIRVILCSQEVRILGSSKNRKLPQVHVVRLSVTMFGIENKLTTSKYYAV